MKAIDSLESQAPWDVRADEVCLADGNKELSVHGTPLQQLQSDVAITKAALSELEDVSSSVPVADALQYGNVLNDKRGIVAAQEHELALMEARQPTHAAAQAVQSAYSGYAFDAQELNLHVCGQGTGSQ